MGILRGAGNAIVPQVAAAFVMAYMEARECPCCVGVVAGTMDDGETPWLCAHCEGSGVAS